MRAARPMPALLAFAVCLSPTVLAAGGFDSSVDLKFHSTVVEIAEMLSSLGDVPIAVDACAWAKPISLEIKAPTIEAALDSLTSQAGLRWAKDGAVFEIGCPGEGPIDAVMPAPRTVDDNLKRHFLGRRRAQAEAPRTPSACTDEYRADLAWCHAEYSVPGDNVPSPRGAQDCVGSAQRFMRSCLGFPYSSAPNAPAVAGRRLVNGGHTLKAYEIENVGANGYGWSISIPPAEAGRWVLHLLNGFPDSVPDDERCRAIAAVTGPGAEISGKEFNARHASLDVPMTFVPGDNTLSVVLNRARRRDPCRYGFVFAWLERVEIASATR